MSTHWSYQSHWISSYRELPLKLSLIDHIILRSFHFLIISFFYDQPWILSYILCSYYSFISLFVHTIISLFDRWSYHSYSLSTFDLITYCSYHLWLYHFLIVDRITRIIYGNICSYYSFIMSPFTLCSYHSMIISFFDRTLYQSLIIIFVLIYDQRVIFPISDPIIKWHEQRVYYTIKEGDDQLVIRSVSDTST